VVPCLKTDNTFLGNFYYLTHPPKNVCDECYELFHYKFFVCLLNTVDIPFISNISGVSFRSQLCQIKTGKLTTVHPKYLKALTRILNCFFDKLMLSDE
jgi:hypothetical protein